MNKDERTYECTSCGHAYTAKYGSDVEVPGGIDWRCFPCQGVKR